MRIHFFVESMAFIKYEKTNEVHNIFFFKKLVFNALRGIDAMQKTSNKSLDAIPDALRQPVFGGRAWLFALRANVHSMIFFTKRRKGCEIKKKQS